MGSFLDKLEEFERSYLLAAIRIYLLNLNSRKYIPVYVKSSFNNWQDDLAQIIRHYINFDEITITPQLRNKIKSTYRAQGQASEL